VGVGGYFRGGKKGQALEANRLHPSRAEDKNGGAIPLFSTCPLDAVLN
jgi:hypothetical protein